MGRPLCAAVGGLVYDVVNRANARLPLLQKEGDYQAFERVFTEARKRFELPLLAYGVMPNHWHLVLWSHHPASEAEALLSPWPVAPPRSWGQWVNEPQSIADLEAVRRCVQRGQPFGHADWVRETVERLNLQDTLRPQGRPRKTQVEIGS